MTALMKMPPTDNLYKFIAITGVILVLAPWFILLPEYRAVSARSYDLRREDVALRADVKRENVRLEAVLKRAAELDARRDRLTPAERAEADRIRADSLQQLAGGELQVKVAQESLQAEEIDALTTDLDKLLNVGGWTSATGIILAGIGFQLWYRRVQRYEDQAITETRRHKE